MANVMKHIASARDCNQRVLKQIAATRERNRHEAEHARAATSDKLVSLRKELARVENEKALMEEGMLNQLTALHTEKVTLEQDLNAKLQIQEEKIQQLEVSLDESQQKTGRRFPKVIRRKLASNTKPGSDTSESIQESRTFGSDFDYRVIASSQSRDSGSDGDTVDLSMVQLLDKSSAIGDPLEELSGSLASSAEVQNIVASLQCLRLTENEGSHSALEKVEKDILSLVKHADETIHKLTCSLNEQKEGRSALVKQLAEAKDALQVEEIDSSSNASEVSTKEGSKKSKTKFGMSLSRKRSTKTRS